MTHPSLLSIRSLSLSQRKQLCRSQSYLLMTRVTIKQNPVQMEIKAKQCSRMAYHSSARDYPTTHRANFFSRLYWRRTLQKRSVAENHSGVYHHWIWGRRRAGPMAQRSTHYRTLVSTRLPQSPSPSSGSSPDHTTIPRGTA